MKLALFAIMIFCALVGSGCGVKGDPVPPETAPQLGRGRPNFKGAAKSIRVKPESVGLAPTRTYLDDEAAETAAEEEEREVSQYVEVGAGAAGDLGD